MIGTADRQMRQFEVRPIKFKGLAVKVYLMFNTGCPVASCFKFWACCPAADSLLQIAVQVTIFIILNAFDCRPVETPEWSADR